MTEYHKVPQMLELSSIQNLNPFAESNLLAPTLAVLFALKVVGIAKIVPIVKLYWAKVLWESIQSGDQNS